ncbi:PKHD-type hydroxylase [Oceanospirillum multiglobuliferum]|uniref:Fe2+-dependent dioxygenase n=1 Tax=Oceanospirillum multiglobuliferum TaxID=64969 RepID=A0A1T4NAV4_9GAMM|nr:Fe2+-dependent dioxygenase [Oceanospirillum multiglobuliferum]OPX55963.1 Fe2+-dependent dioxygenase [Oceanospirillum multiglobuliferum]SJZ76364.1 PKHD-type hydroxylase [Oceanospirillum multiglobuliferum]
MIITIPSVLSKDEAAQFYSALQNASWEEGGATAGTQAATVKQNLQLPANDQLAQQLSDYVLQALARHPRFISATLPQKIYPPLFNCYREGGQYGTHVDNAVRTLPNTPLRLRTDLSATLFLNEPDTYEGGELEIIQHWSAPAEGESSGIKLSAGDLIIYPSTREHRVHPVTKGDRICAFFWLQSMVRDHEQRELLFELDESIQALTLMQGHEQPEVVRLTALYHRLVRQWVDT